MRNCPSVLPFYQCPGVRTRRGAGHAASKSQGQCHSSLTPVFAVVCSSADPGGRGAADAVCCERVSWASDIGTSGKRQVVAVEHSRQVLDTLDRLRAIVADLEAERRGYLLTLDPAYLKPYGVSDESVRREGEALQKSRCGRSVAEPSCRTSGADRFSKAARDGRHRQDGPHLRAGCGAGDASAPWTRSDRKSTRWWTTNASCLRIG